MTLDPYSPCPCGSGKKVKFCCAAIVAEMDAVQRLHQSGQDEACLKKLGELAAKHPRNAWVLNYRASLHLTRELPEEAQADLRIVLEDHADHPMSLLLYANASMALGGIDVARPAVHRCFQKCVRELPEFVGDLAINIANEMLIRQQFMAARQYLAFAMRFVSDENRETVFRRLHEFDSNVEIPYPLRSVHLLAEEQLEGPAAKDADKARRLAEIGCWGPAAKVYAQLSAAHPENAALHQNLGLCRAWDGDQATAAVALHAAAKAHTDRASAVECETVAQLLDRFEIEDRVYVEGWMFDLDSVARVLGAFEGDSRFVKLPLPPKQQGSTEQEPAAFFQVLDRPAAGIQLTPESRLEDVPLIIGHLSIYDRDRDGDEPAHAFFTGFQRPEFDAARESIVSRFGAELQGEPRREDDLVEDSVAAEEQALFWRWHCPQGTPQVVRRQLEQRMWERTAREVWMRTPLHALGGQPPQEAVGNAEQAVPLLAAVYVLDAFCDSNRHVLDFAAQCALVGIEPLPPIHVTSETPIAHFSAMQFCLIDVQSLADEQLIYVSNRAIMLRHGTFLYQTLEELLSRPECRKRVSDLQDVYLTMVELSTELYRRDLAFEWIERAREWAGQQPQSFELKLQWDMRELMLRLDDPTDERLPGMFRDMTARYGKKVPEVMQYLAVLSEAYGVSSMLDQAAIATAGGNLPGGLWTPGDEAVAEQGKKLWLPGQ